MPAVADRNRIPVRFTVHSDVKDQPEHNALALFRVLQEALQNVAKHAAACAVYVSLVRSVDHVRLRVRDSGAGFRVE